MTPDIIIVGQGLAGSCLAWRFITEGYKVCVVDQNRKHSASQVSQGFMNPIVGTKMTLSWNYNEHNLAATKFYKEVEQNLSCSLIHDLPNQRFFQSQEQLELFKKRLSQKYFPSSIKAALFQSKDTPKINQQYGSLITTGQQLDVPLFLSKIEQYLLKTKSLIRESFSYDSLSI